VKRIFFSDIHNNYFAVKAFFQYLEDKNFDDIELYFLGDVFGYLKFDERIINSFIKMNKKFNIKMIVGNHDGVLLNYWGKTNLNINISNALVETVEKNKEYKVDIMRLLNKVNLKEMIISINGKSTIVSHAGISDIYNDYYYADRKFIEKYKKYFKLNTDYIFGHTHRPFIIENCSNRFINVGSLGLPRDNDPRLSFLIIDENNTWIERLFYQLDKAYEYNVNLKNSIKNRIYFGGNSHYIGYNLLDLSDKHKLIMENFNEYNQFKRAVYITQDKSLYQIFKLKIKNTNQFLLKTSKNEIVANSIFDVIRRIKYEKI